MVMRLDIMMMAVRKFLNLNKVIREMKHRAPALTGYMEALTLDQDQMIPATLPPSTTRAQGQTAKTLQLPYPEDPEMCPHDVESARRMGNAKGRFMECIQCGLVKKALDQNYMVPISKVTVPVYAITHGVRDRPGGKVQPHFRSPQGLSDSWAECYSLSSRSASSQPSRRHAPPTTASSSRRSSRTSQNAGYPMDFPNTSRSDWEQVGMEEDDETL
jgi:hypothetical protein